MNLCLVENQDLLLLLLSGQQEKYAQNSYDNRKMRPFKHPYINIRLKVRLQIKLLLLCTGANIGLRIGGHALLKEVVLALESNLLHEIKGIRGIRIDLSVVQLDGQAIRYELNILAHELGVHANKIAGERLGDKLLLNLYGLPNDLVDLGLWHLLHNLLIQGARKVRVKTLIARNEFIAQRKTRHDTALLKPEDSTEGTAKEDALHDGEPNEPRGKVLLPRLNPLLGPIGLLGDRGNRLNGLKGLVLDLLVLNIGVNQQRIGL